LFNLSYFILAHYQPLSKNKENHQNEWNSFIEETIGTSQKYDFGVACSFGYMIPNNIIDLFPKGLGSFIYQIHNPFP